MYTSTTALRDPLPLIKIKAAERKTDWVGLWEDWSRLGAVVLLESAGPLQESGRWILLAGDPEMEFYGVGGNNYWRDPHFRCRIDLSFGDFVNEVGGPTSVLFPSPFCFSQAWFGVMGYEMGRRFAVRNPKHLDRNTCGENDFYFFKPKIILAFDRLSGETHAFGRSPLEILEVNRRSSEPFQIRDLQALSSISDYENLVLRAQAYIASGDIYQANLAQTFQAKWSGNPGNLYRLLRDLNPGPFMGLFKGPGFTVVSSSPERMVSGQGDRLETRPIAGTRPRGVHEIEDLQLKWELQTNLKEQAEHTMLVDLARNDLGRVAEYGSVWVKEFRLVESYSKVHHLVSVVRARRRSGATLSDILNSIFPAGTITGCPKMRCMEIIEELEGRPRGFYTGSMGYIAPGPYFDLNILIRSFTLMDDGLLEFKAGAGIVADSDPRREYMETLYKVEALAQSLGTSLLPLI